ncbi:MAG: hypothetical protein AB1642_04545 [Pseudomonadota bacterium]
MAIGMVMGDGTAPLLSHWVIAILDFSVKLFGISQQGGLFTAAILWASITFVVVFLGNWLIRK